METFGFRADGGARNKPLHDCSNERAAEADECCEDFGRHVIGGEVSQMALNSAARGCFRIRWNDWLGMFF